MSRRHNTRATPDIYAKRAKADGAPARSVYKLEEMDLRWRLLRPGQIVLDLGAAPGSWTQYASTRVGLQGRVIAYDLQPLRTSLGPNVTFSVQDVYALNENLPPIDVVLSDMAPATMGHHKTDALRSAALAEHALYIAQQYGQQGSALVVKVLEGGEVPALAKAIAKDYTKLERLRPKATRKDSTEIFLLGFGKRAAGLRVS